MEGGAPYREWTDAELADRLQRSGVEVIQDGRRVTFRWECPACGHDCSRPMRVGPRAVGLSGLRRGGQPRSSVEILSCTCLEEHPQRPDGVEGCGFWARITVTTRRR